MLKSQLVVAALLSFLSTGTLQAQTPLDQAPSPDSNSQRLPFQISEDKRLSEEDLANKREGTFVTGVPDLSSDPLNGFGFGAEGYVTFNGTRKDPFFAYTPYRGRLEVAAFYTTKRQRELKLAYDIPYIFNSLWRLRVEAAYEVNPNQLYFGITTNSLKPLHQLFVEQGLGTAPQAAGIKTYDDYVNALETIHLTPAGPRANTLYNYFTKEEAILNVSLERSIFQSRARVLGGYEVAYLHLPTPEGTSVAGMDPATGSNYNVPNDSTLLAKDYHANRINGAQGGTITILQSGFVWDTRDLEPDPSKGVFAELTNELSLPVLGSRYTFDKVFLHAKVYKRLLPRTFTKLVFAARGGLGYTFGNAPFFEYQDQWSSEGSIEGLGGFHTLRGYKQARFLGRMMSFENVELRYRFAQFKLLKQQLGLMAVPFFDAGAVWDNVRTFNFNNYRFSEGAGLRLAWNLSTILSFDYAVSQEDKQFFFQFTHAF